MAQLTGPVDKSKDLQKEILMEKLRSKNSQLKNLTETSKAVRMAMLDKRWAVDSVDRMILQKCLDSLQHCIKVSSLQSLIERLDCLSRQLGLKFVVGNSGVNLFISSDMFYLEVLVEASGAVKDVKIHHEGKIEQQSCSELVACVARGDFADFTAQLEGLTAVYQLNAEKKIKCAAFSALQALEEDLCTLAALAGGRDPLALVLRGPVGHLQRRRGGHAMRLTYFISPYELLDKEKGLLPLTAELLERGKPVPASDQHSLVAPTHAPVGHSALVMLEGSAPNKLQLSTIITGGQRQPKGSSSPAYAPLVPQNSALLPASFSLRLSQPTPLCRALANIIQSTTEVEVAGDWSAAAPLMTLVAQEAYDKLAPGKNIQLNLSKGLFVSLPDQTHCYLLSNSPLALTVTHVRVTSPRHVPPALALLRQQALLNTLLASTVRTQRPADPETTLMFEVSVLSWQHVSVSLEHPLEETLATVELDLGDAAAPRAAVFAPPAAARDHVDEYISRVLQKSHSIPVTLRALIKVWEREAAAKQLSGGYAPLEKSNFSSGPGALDPGGAPPPPPLPAAAHGLSNRAPAAGAGGGGGGGFLPDGKHMSLLGADDAARREPDERRGKKRKSDDQWAGDSDSSPCTSDDSDSSRDGVASSVSQNDFASDAELATDAEVSQEQRVSSDMDNSNSVDGDDDMSRHSFQKSEHKRQKLKNKEERSRSSLLLELTDGKPYMPSSVSITPIPAAGGGAAGAGGGGGALLALDRRPGIEIIPITPAAPALPSSITITPITPTQARSLDERIRSDKKAGREERSKEKKKKKRRDDSMGPPEKVPPKQDPLTKPVSVSIKPADGSPLRAASPTALLRKFSPSPTHGRPVTVAKSPSPGAGKSGKSSAHSSPRHSPVQNSPKHLSGYSSPKNHSVASPKHSSSSSGKPSMSTLKSAAVGSPSGKSGGGYDLSKKMSKDFASSSSRDKEKKHSGLSFSSSGRSSPKLKNQVKLKQLEITPIPADVPVSEPLVSPPNMEPNKSIPSQVRNRKGSLSAVIDKLKSAQHVGEGEAAKPAPPPAKYADPKNSNPKLETKNQEYMVKPSSDGMKITINKTRTKESGSSKTGYSSSSSKQSSPQLTPPSQGSPKTHTGLKPGVISGPASKKTQALQSSKSGSSGGTPPKANMSPSDSSSSSSSAPKVPYSKSSSSAGVNLSKSSSKSSSGSPKSSSTDMAKIVRDREREKARAKLAGGGDKSIFSSKSERHASPGGSRDEVDGDRYKAKESSNFLVEGLIKPLDTSKFQIPKLKNQTTPDKGGAAAPFDTRALPSDFSRGMEPKYPFAYHSPNARAEETPPKAYPLTVPKPPPGLGCASPKSKEQERPMELLKAAESADSSPRKDDKDFPFPLLPLDMAKGFAPPKGAEERAAGAAGGATTPQEAAEMLLDFSSSSGKVSGLVAVRPARDPHDPPRPDDPRADEALVGPGK